MPVLRCDECQVDRAMGVRVCVTCGYAGTDHGVRAFRAWPSPSTSLARILAEIEHLPDSDLPAVELALARRRLARP